MATLNVTPSLEMVRKNTDGSYQMICAMLDANGVNRGYRELHIKTDGTVLDAAGNLTGLTAPAGHLTAQNTAWTNWAADLAAADAANKLPF